MSLDQRLFLTSIFRRQVESDRRRNDTEMSYNHVGSFPNCRNEGAYCILSENYRCVLNKIADIRIGSKAVLKPPGERPSRS